MTMTSSIEAQPRRGARAKAVLAALVALAGVIWFGESILLSVLGATARAEVTAVRERIVYDVDTQARHVFEVDLRYIGGAKTGAAAGTLSVDAGSFDALAIGDSTELREITLGASEGGSIRRLAAQPLNGGIPVWLKAVALLAVLLWTTFKLPRLRPFVLIAAALGVILFAAARASAQSANESMPLTQANASVLTVIPVQINRGGNDEGARYLFSIDDQLVLPEALVDGAFVELEFVPAGWRRPVIAVDVAGKDALKAGDSVQVLYAPNAPRSARSAQTTRAPASGAVNPWLLALAGCALLGGLEWLGRRLAADRLDDEAEPG